MTDPATASGQRLNRFLARRGVASRRAADGLIAAGRVDVNGAVATLGSLVSALDTVKVDGHVVPPEAPSAVTLALNKPVGVVSTAADPMGRPTVIDLAPPLPGLVPVGRLDADSRGLLLLSSDGELAHRVAHPRHGLHKTYRVRTSVPVDDQSLDRLGAGIDLHDGPARIVGHRRGDDPRVIDLVMGEGRKREVRRLLAAVGAVVVDLCRIAVGPVQLGDLQEGDTRPLTAAELAALRVAVGADSAAPGGGAAP